MEDLYKQLIETIKNRTEYQIAAASCVVGIVIWTAFGRRGRKKYNYPPEPGNVIPLVGNVQDVPTDWSKLPQYFIDVHKKHGKMVSWRFFNFRTVAICDPEVVKKMAFSKDFENIPLPSITATLGPHSLVVLNGEEWKRHRTLITPIFGRENLRAFVPTIHEKTDILITKWKEFAGKDSINVAKFVNRLTLDAFSKAVFHFDLNVQSDPNGELATALDITLQTIASIQATMFPKLFPLLHPIVASRYAKSRKLLLGLVHQLMDSYKKSEGTYDKSNFVALLLEAENKETNQKLTEEEIVDELMGFLIAGFETTSSTINWFLYHVSKHPEVQSKIQQELATVLEGRTPSFDDLDKLVYLTSALKESQRVTPALFGVFLKQTANNVDIEGYHMKKGTGIIYSTYAIQHSNTYWEDPDTFKPERWLQPEDESKKILKFLPFGAGYRMCVGHKFAEMEMRVIIAKLLQRYSFHFDTSKKFVSHVLLAWTPVEMYLQIKERK